MFTEKEVKRTIESMVYLVIDEEIPDSQIPVLVDKVYELMKPYIPLKDE